MRACFARPCFRWIFSVSLAAIVGACAEGDAGPTSGDAGARDAAMDAGSRDATLDANGSDGAPPPDATSCPSGQHRCGAGCVADQPNLPERGCRLACGTDPCPTPMGGVALCTVEGRCEFECPAPWSRDGERCVCTAQRCEDLGATCGTYDDGCGGTLTCGMCGSGQSCDEESRACECTADRGEPNPSSVTAFALPEFTDSPDTMMSFGADFGIGAADDVDFFSFHVVDGFDTGNPVVRITLDGIPTGSNYDLAAWYVCDDGGNVSTCNIGAADSTLGAGCRATGAGTTIETVEIATDCDRFGTGDDGTVYVRVTAPTWSGACDRYTLDIAVR